jgi:hypothetical protein
MQQQQQQLHHMELQPRLSLENFSKNKSIQA